MGKAYDSVPDSQAEFIKKQKIFFVATANLSPDGHINVSPKGHDCFTLIDKNTCAYLDLSGSGAETAAHLMQEGNGRITIMFCAFEGSPNILRLYGKGKIVLRQDTTKDLLSRFPEDMVKDPGFRAIVVIDIHRVSTSCGFAVPFFDYKEDRNVLKKHFAKKKQEDMDQYRVKKNSFSIDGEPSLGQFQETFEGQPIEPYDAKGYHWGRIAPGKKAPPKGYGVSVDGRTLARRPGTATGQ